MAAIIDNVHNVLRDIPIGFAQVMLQPSHRVGLIFLVGAFWNDWVIALFGLLGCSAGAAAARLLGYPDKECDEGLYGFNGALVGLGSAYFHAPDLMLVACVMIGGSLSSVVMHAMLRSGLKPFTFPFVTTTWAIFAVLSTVQAGQPPTEDAPPVANLDITAGFARGVGQVLFQESVVTGTVLLVAVFFRDRCEGLFAAGAAAIGVAAGAGLGFPIDAITLGLFGYNGVLCAILFAGTRLRDVASALTAVCFSILIVRLFHLAGLPAFTFPFVLSSWIVLWFTRTIRLTP